MITKKRSSLPNCVQFSHFGAEELVMTKKSLLFDFNHSKLGYFIVLKSFVLGVGKFLQIGWAVSPCPPALTAITV